MVAWLGTPWLGEALQGPVRRAALVARAHPAPAVQWDVRLPSFSFYRGAETPRRPPAPGELALTRASALASLPGAEVLYREAAYALVRAPPPADVSAQGNGAGTTP